MSYLSVLSQLNLPQGWTALRMLLGSAAIATSSTVAKSLSIPRPVPKLLSRLEWTATLQLLLIAAIALPLLPNQAMGPWSTINPRTIGFLILFIAGISFVGHFAMRLFGSRVGLLATAAIGGLVSSTAVTLSFARRAKKDPENIPVLAAGISLAAAIMALRVILEVAVVNGKLLPLLVPPLACLAIIPFIAAIAIAIKIPVQGSRTNTNLDNPLELGSAVFFGLVLAILFVLVRATEEWFGETGVYLLSAISGITDVDALSLSLAESTLRTLSLPVGALGIYIGAAVNTVVKGIMATSIGGLKLGKWCASILLIALILSAIAMGGSLWIV